MIVYKNMAAMSKFDANMYVGPHYCRLSVRNVRWLRRMLPPGESWLE